LRDFKTNPDTTQTNLYNRQYSYNTASNISQIKIGNQTKDYNYDLIDRLTQVISSNAQQNENYSFDAVGNRLTSHLSTTYQYAAFNRLAQSQQASFVYDNNGNMTSRTDSSGTTQYIWDFENRLRQVIKPDGTSINYKYNALGQRTERYVGANSTKFTYDGDDVLLDVNSDSSFVKYVNGLGIDDKIRQTVNGQAQYFVQDHLGSTNALTDATGTVISSASYDSFGNASGNLATRYGYTGREKDADTGLHYYRARWYDSNLGRFLSEDPIGFGGGDVNLFGYVGNNPLMNRDPSGKIPPLVVGGGGDSDSNVNFPKLC
jgi:RHS repeat-associated protein